MEKHLLAASVCVCLRLNLSYYIWTWVLSDGGIWKFFLCVETFYVFLYSKSLERRDVWKPKENGETYWDTKTSGMCCQENDKSSPSSHLFRIFSSTHYCRLFLSRSACSFFSPIPLSVSCLFSCFFPIFHSSSLALISTALPLLPFCPSLASFLLSSSVVSPLPHSSS